MTTLALPCSACRVLTALAPGEVLLYLPSPVLVLHGRVASYAFVCPACSCLAVGLADRRTIALLRQPTSP